MRHLSVMLLAVFLFCAVVPSQSLAAWPDGKTITMVVPFAAGGNSDIVARALIPQLEKVLNTRVVVRNVGGGAGTLGAAEVAKAAPDGLTIGYLPTGPYLIQPLLRNLPYTSESFTPIGLVTNTPYVFMVSEKSPFKTLEDVRKAVTKDPDKYAIGSSGPGTMPHLASLAMITSLGGKVKHIPDRSTAEGMKSLAGNVVQFFSDTVTLIRMFDVRPLGIFSETRFPSYPDLPTMKEQGYDLEFSIWGAVFAPAGLSGEEQQKLTEAVREAVNSPEFTEIARKNDIMVQHLEGEALVKFCEDEKVKAQKMVDEFGLARK